MEWFGLLNAFAIIILQPTMPCHIYHPQVCCNVEPILNETQRSYSSQCDIYIKPMLQNGMTQPLFKINITNVIINFIVLLMLLLYLLSL